MKPKARERERSNLAIREEFMNHTISSSEHRLFSIRRRSMSCASPQLVRLLEFRRPLRAPSHFSSPAVMLYPLNFVLTSNLIETSRRNRAILRCFPAFVAKDENSTAISTDLEDSDGTSAGETIIGREDGVSDDTVLVYSSCIDLKQQLEKSISSIIVSPLRFLSSIRRRRRTRAGVLVNAGVMISLVVFLLAFDWYSRRILRLPLQPFYFSRPFFISAALSGFAGWLYVPIVDNMKIHQVLRIEGPSTHSSKRGTPTMGGLFFIPIGIAVASLMSSHTSSPLYGTILATLAFASIGLVDDLLSCIKSHNYGLPGWIKLGLQAAIGGLFAFWLDSTNASILSNMKFSVHLPQPFGLVYLGKYYLALTAFCFASMGNGVNLTDGLDGLAGGVAAWAFIGMSVAILAISPDLAVFGASMSGACIGFLFHNRYKASIFMGDTGSLGLGGALAAMAACTGMFLPLFISSGVFVMEVVSVILQVLAIQITKRLYGVSRRVFRMAPVHHHFELCGFREPIIVASAYFVSSILALIAGYIGIVSLNQNMVTAYFSTA